MEYNVFIEDLTPGADIEGFYVLKAAAPKSTANGKPYLTATLSDCTGAIEAKVWDYTGPIGSHDAGKVIKICGSVSEFKGALQIIIDRVRLADENDTYDIKSLVPSAPIDVQEEYEFILELVESLDDEDYRKVCGEMLRRHSDALKNIPAAKSVHHGFLNGLLMHTANMLKTADFLSSIYPDTVDRNLLIAGTLLHDFAKEKEFKFSELGLAVDYSVKGQLLGHLVMGAQEVCEVSRELGIPEDKSILLQHMILSHHGEPEFGAAVRPMCAESELLSYIDLLDSRMEIYRETFNTVPTGEFSGRIFSLDKKIFHHSDL